MGRVKFESTLGATQNVLIAGALVVLRLQYWLQSDNVTVAKSAKVIHPPPAPNNTCIVCDKTITQTAELRLTEKGQIIHEWCMNDLNANLISLKLN